MGDANRKPEQTLTPEQWRLIDDLFAQVSEQPDPDRAIALLADCADPVVRAEVESLLGHVTGENTNLQAVVGRVAGQLGASRQLGRRIGPYKLVGQLGEGGMGVVYAAERDDAEFKRTVAIKILQHGFGTQAAIARFRDERQILATLEHPGIVRLLDGGTTDDGSPYLVMERVDGVPITKYAADLSIRERVELVRAVCGALQYAHGRLVVHRDIKPSNILVTADGTPKLLDFGIAKLIDPSAAREAQTGTGVGLLTPAYASPEQARAEPIGVATDVYSTGAVLYELLTGTLPLRVQGSPLEILRTICEVDPQLPSTHRRELAGDLDNIVMKALAKDPKRRYPSIEAFADDLRRYRDGEPVSAREATFGYRASKFVRRHGGKLVIASCVVAVLSAATAISLTQARRADFEALQAQHQLMQSYEEAGRRALLERDYGAALVYLNEATRMGAFSPALDFMISRAVESLQPTSVSLLHDKAPSSVDVTADGTNVLTAASDGTVRTWDMATGRQLHRFDGHAPGLVTARFQPHGELIASKDTSGAIRLWKRSGAIERVLRGIPQPTPSFAFTRDGQAIVDATGEAWSVRLGESIAPPRTKSPNSNVDTAPDARHLVTIDGPAGHATIAELGTERSVVLRGHTAPLRFARFDPHGHRIATASDDRTARIWDVSSGASLHALQHEQRVTNVAFSPNGELLATASADRAVRLWDVQTGELLRTLNGHTGQVNRVTFTTDGAFAITIGADGAVNVFDVRDGTRIATYFHGGYVSDLAVTRDGARVVTVSSVGTARVWEIGRRSRLASWPSGSPRASNVAFASGPNGRFLRTEEHEAVVWDPRSGTTQQLRFSGTLADSALSQDGALVALATTDGSVSVLATADGSELQHLTVASSALAFDPLTRRLATSSVDGRVRLWEVSPSGTELARRDVGHPVSRIVFSSNGSTLLAEQEGGPKLASTLSGDKLEPLATIEQEQWLASMTSPDGRMVSSTPGGTTYMIWSSHGESIRRLPHQTAVISAAWSSASDRIAVGAMDGSVTIWPTTIWAPRRFRAHENYVIGLAFSPNNELLATAGGDRTLRIWEVGTSRQLFAFPLPEGTTPYLFFDAAAELLIAAGLEQITSWDIPVRHYTAPELDRLVRCGVPLQLRDSQLEAREIEHCPIP